MRVSSQQLTVLTNAINRCAGTPATPFSVYEGRGLHANVGCFHITVPYRGNYALECIVNETGGCRTIIPACKKTDMYHRLTAFLGGMEAGMKHVAR
jgi:hypothetical protein